jgi:hypothetical protein
LIILSIEPPNYSIPAFRIYIEAAGLDSDVRLDGSADLYVRPIDGDSWPVDRSFAPGTSAYDRVDDRDAT